MIEAVRTSETSVDNYFTRQYIPEDSEFREYSSLLNGFGGSKMFENHCSS
jgi:hypothetical protein